MKRIFRWVIIVALAAGLGWWLWQRYGVTEEKRVARVIGKMQQLVEQNKGIPLAVGLEGCIAQDYGGLGLNKPTLIEAVVGYRGQADHASISISNLKITITPKTETTAASAEATFDAQVTASTKGGTVGTVEQYTDRYRIKFRKTEMGWQMTHAEGTKSEQGF